MKEIDRLGKNYNDRSSVRQLENDDANDNRRKSMNINSIGRFREKRILSSLVEDRDKAKTTRRFSNKVSGEDLKVLIDQKKKRGRISKLNAFDTNIMHNAKANDVRRHRASVQITKRGDGTLV